MKLLIAASIFAVFTVLLYLPAGADDNEGVEILVTPKIIAISIDESQLDYGSPEVGSIDNRPSPGDFTVTNDSTVAIDLQIAGSDSQSVVDSSPGWTLSGTPGSDQYVHRFSIMTTPNYPADFSILTTAPTPFLGSVAVAGTFDLKLSLDMPTSTSTLDQQTANVIVVALEH